MHVDSLNETNKNKGDNNPSSFPASKSSRATAIENDEDADAEFSYLESCKSLFLISLPHFTIILLFVIYVLVGAAILKEIESEGPAAAVVEPVATSPSAPSLPSVARLQYNKEIEMAALKLADTQRSNLNKFLADAKTQYTHLDAENKKLAGSFNEMVIRSLNLTNYYRTVAAGGQEGELTLKSSAKKPGGSHGNAAAVATKKKKSGEDLDEIEDDLADLNETVDQRETIRFISAQLSLNKNALTSSSTDKSSSNSGKKKKKASKAAAAAEQNKQQINSKQVLRSIAEHLINHKLQLKVSIVDNAKTLLSAHHKDQVKTEASIQKLVADYNARLKSANDHFLSEVARLTAKFNMENSESSSNNEPPTTTTNPLPTPKVQAKKWTMQNSIYFVGTLLTTIGYGDISPQSLFGKLFTMVYLFIGLPLTLLLVADLGTILTRYIKFLYLFLLILYRDGYYEQFGHQLKTKMPFLRIFSFLFFLKSSKKQRTSSQRAQAKKSSTRDDGTEDDIDTTNYDENESVYAPPAANQPGIFRSLFEIGMSCLEQADDKFNIKLSSLFGLVYVYLTLGAIVASRYADWSILDGYYFCLITLTRIGFGDLTIDNPKFMLITSFYTLFGLAFFALTMQTLQEKMRLQFISNGQRLVDEFIKFISQFGYAPNTEEIHMNLASFCKGPRIVDSSLASSEPSSLPLTPSKAAASGAGMGLGLNCSSSNLSASFSNGMAASTSTPNIAGAAGYMLDDDELFLSSVNLNQLASKNSSYLMNNQLMRRRTRRSNLFRGDTGELKFRGGLFDMINKCDKQTQITTLLCSKFKYDKEAVELSGFGAQDHPAAKPVVTQSSSETQTLSAKSNVASVKPSIFYQAEINEDDEPKRSSSTTINEEEEVTVVKLSRIPTIVKSSPPSTPAPAPSAAPRQASSPSNEDEATTTVRPPVRRNRFGALATDTAATTTTTASSTGTGTESSSSRASPVSSPRTYSFKR